MRAGLRLRSGASALALLLAAGPVRADPSVSIVPLAFSVAEFRGPGSRVASVAATLDALRENRSIAAQPLVVVWGDHQAAALTLDGDALRVMPLGGVGDLRAIERGKGAIPSSRVAVTGPLTATLTDPTTAYPHEALGSSVHAAAVTISEKRAVQPGPAAAAVPVETSRVDAGAGAVFEDREVRPVALGEGSGPVLVAIKSYGDRGSALAVISRQGGSWRVSAETPPLGEPATWLNPAAFGPFGADDSAAVALVARPHLDGLLQVWTMRPDGLTLTRQKAGYSNHAFGQSAQGLSALVEHGAAGGPDLAIPTLDRKSLALVALKPDLVEIWRIPLPAAALTGVAVLGRGSGAHILVGLSDGRVADVRP